MSMQKIFKKVFCFLLIGSLAFGDSGCLTTQAFFSEPGANQTINISASRDAATQSQSEITDICTNRSTFISALSQMFVDYPCDYDEILEININDKNVYDTDGKTIDATDTSIEKALNQNNAADASQVLEENGYIILDVSSDVISVENPYQTMRLIIRSDTEPASFYGAEKAINYGSEYFLQYTSVEDTINAYNEFLADEETTVYIDSVVSLCEDDSEDEVTAYSFSNTADGIYCSWGTKVMGLDEMQEELENGNDELDQVIVAVVDTGVYYTNTYLEDRILSDDGYDFANNDSDALDDNGHGTHIAGIITDGTSDNVEILPIKALSSNGSGSVSAVYCAIIYALDYGADVINISLGMTDSDGTLSYFEDLFEEAEDEDCVVVCAAGNSSSDTAYIYPASSDLVLTVSALTQTPSGVAFASNYSNYGDEVNFAAPGTAINSTYITSDTSTATMTGTSMATAHVTAAVALLKTWDNSLTNEEVDSLLQDYSVDLGDEGWDEYYGYGYIYLGDFVGDNGASSESANDSSDSKDDQTLTVSATSSSIYVGKTSQISASTTGDGSITYYSNDTSVATVSSSGVVTGVSVGTATVTVKAEATSNYNSATQRIVITVKLATPTICSLSNTTSGMKLTWSKVAGASGYYIYRSTSSSGTYTKIATIKNNSTITYTFGTSGTYKVTSGTLYYYKVTAYYGSYTNTSAAKCLRYLTAGKITSLTNVSGGVKIKWSKVSGASGYYIYRKTSSGSYTKIKKITSGSTVSYTDTAVKNKNGKTYIYKVVPYKGNYTGSYTQRKTVRLVATSISGLKNSSSKKMTVKWSKKSSVTGYQIRYSTDSSFSSYKTITLSGASRVSKTISGLTKGKRYYVRIRTYKTVSGTKYYSAWSSKKSVKISK